MATKETMTVHKALAELKLLDDRIKKTIEGGTYCAAIRHSNDKIHGIPVADFMKNAQSSFNKATDLICRRKAIKRAVVNSNATARVKIGGIEYTVAEAIEMKNHGINFENQLIQVLTEQYREAQNEISIRNSPDLERRADEFVTSLYGDREGKGSAVDIDKIRADYLRAIQYELLDPIHILNQIEQLGQKNNEFLSEVDAALSVSNALTEITIEY